MKTGIRKLMLSVAFAGVFISAGSAHAATVSGFFTDRQGDVVNWTAIVDPGITLSTLHCCALPGNQGDGTITNYVNAVFTASFSGNVGKQDSLSGFQVNWSGPSADTFAIHFGGPHGGNELLLALSGSSSTFNFSMTGTQYALSSIQGFGEGGGVSQAPLPAALPLFASGLGGMGLFAWWRKRKARAAA